MFGAARFLQRNGFPNHRLSWIAPQTGVRETCQIAGRYVLTEEDCKAGRRYPDVVAQTNYGIDVHNPTGAAGTVQCELPLYDIPYRCLVPASGAGNVIVAGRTLSATPVAMSSARVMPTCMALGQAAGCAAAVALRSGRDFAEIDIAELHTALEGQGVLFALAPGPTPGAPPGLGVSRASRQGTSRSGRLGLSSPVRVCGTFGLGWPTGRTGRCGDRPAVSLDA